MSRSAKEETVYSSRADDPVLDDELQWFANALDNIHSELKGDPTSKPMPQFKLSFKHASLSTDQQGRVYCIWNTLNTIKTKARACTIHIDDNAENINAQLRTTALIDEQSKDDKSNLEAYMQRIYDIEKLDVSKWPNSLEYPMGISPVHKGFYQAIENVYMIAKQGNNHRYEAIKDTDEMEKQLNEKENELKAKDKELNDIRSLSDQQSKDDIRKLESYMQQIENFSRQHDVSKWPNVLEYPTDMSPSHSRCYQAIEKVYTIAKRAKQLRDEAVMNTDEMKNLLKEKERELKEKDKELKEKDKYIKEKDTELNDIRKRAGEVPVERMVHAKDGSMEKRFKETENEPERLKHRKDMRDGAGTNENMTPARNVILETQLKEAQKELEEVKLRLSALMGAKLQDGNTNIADLSDGNRPTKIAERFSQLYDDFWTDAFQMLTEKLNRTEEQAAVRLLELLKVAYKFCEEKSEKHSKAILDELLSFGNDSKGSSAAMIKRPQLKDLGEIQRRQFHELRRLTAQYTIEHLQKMFVDYATQKRHGDEVKIKECTSYWKMCVELCWYMILQNPPVHIQFETYTNPGSLFRPEEYRFYSKSGKKLAYIVWPPLRLKKGGELLSKGVAQPMS